MKNPENGEKQQKMVKNNENSEKWRKIVKKLNF